MVELTRPENTSQPVGAPGAPVGGPARWGEPRTHPEWRAVLLRYQGGVRLAVDLAVLAACTVFVVLQLGPTDLLTDSTPAGGDMGAHVWGPAFLRDELLPNFQIAGWAPDWYAGFAAYQFYMVVPMLFIVALDVGVVDLASLPGMVLGVAAAGVVGMAAGMWPDRRWRLVAAAVPIAAVLLLAIPYGVAFKLVAISGPVSLPAAAYLFGRLARLRYPAPSLLAVGTLPFLFYQGYSIYGGNLASMLAGEFAFSLSLSLALVYLGVVLRGVETGRHRLLAAALFALTGLCHIIPAFWMLAATGVIIALRPRPVRAPEVVRHGLPLLGAGAAVTLAGLADWLVLGWPFSALPDGPVALLPGSLSWPLLVTFAGVVVLFVGAWYCSESVRWLLPTVVVGGLLSAFWVVPFVLRSDFVNDMGWEKLGEGDGSVFERWGQYLLPGTEADAVPANDLTWVFVLALVGALLSLALRLRVGLLLAAMTVVTGLAFIFMPEGRLWNGRILPFYYLSALLLAFLAVALVIQLAARIVELRRRSDVVLAGVPIVVGGGAVVAGVVRALTGLGAAFPVVFALAVVVAMGIAVLVWLSAAREPDSLSDSPSEDQARPTTTGPAVGPAKVRLPLLLVGSWGAAGALAAVLLVVGLPLGVVPLSEAVRDDAESAATAYRWPSLSPRQITAAVPETVNVPKWAEWNFRGYEGKDAASDYHETQWAEYSSMFTTMGQVGEDSGCGRALWEYNFDTLNPYGTPMAPMLLPYWTDGCIASMEGLYFEASMTTPYHFLMQSELSEDPSRAQRYMPYSEFDFDLGVQHLQLMGVKYYMAVSDLAIEAARQHPALNEVATSEPWEVFEVADSDLVVPLAYEPAVLSDAGHGAKEWLEEPPAYRVPAARQGRLSPAESGAGDAQPAPWPLAPDGWAEAPPPEGDAPVEHFFGPSVQWFLNPAVWDVPLAVSGPSDWQRIGLEEMPEWRSVPPARVSALEVDRERVSFEVDEPGSPVLVKMSYFPNWQVSGADGPWRVAPNLMVVVPTDREVTLSYGRTPVEWLAYLLTAAGVVGAVVLARQGTYRFDAARRTDEVEGGSVEAA